MYEQKEQELIKPVKIKKVFYKKIWFWVIIVLLIIVGFINFYINPFNTENYDNQSYDTFYKNDPFIFSCNKIMECDASSPEECAKNWLVKSNCVSKNYRDLHYSNFRIVGEEIFNFEKNIQIQMRNNYNFDPIIKTANTKYIVTYDYNIGGETPCRNRGEGYDYCRAIVLKSNNKYYLYSFSGPLKEYEMKYTRKMIINKLRGKIQDDSIYLDTYDALSNSPMEDYDPINYTSNNPHGLYWHAFSESNDKTDPSVCWFEWIIRIDNGNVIKQKSCGI